MCVCVCVCVCVVCVCVSFAFDDFPSFDSSSRFFPPPISQIFLCEQEHNAKANLLGGANKWAKNFLANTGVAKDYEAYNAKLSGETGAGALFGTRPCGVLHPVSFSPFAVKTLNHCDFLIFAFAKQALVE